LLQRDAMYKNGLCYRPVSFRPSVRLSVRPSVTLVYFIYTAEYIVKLLSRPGSPIILVFDPERPYPNARGSRNAKYMGLGICLRISTEIAVYLGNGTR